MNENKAPDTARDGCADSATDARAWPLSLLRRFAPHVTGRDFRTILLIYFGSTAALWVLAYGASVVIREAPKTPDKWHYTAVRALDVWARWDAVLYVDIAARGYQAHQDGWNSKPWFPLYSYLIRFLSLSPGDKADPMRASYYTAAQVISQVCFLLLLFVLFDIVAPRFGKPVAGLACFYISIFPSALYFRAVYTESLFILLILLSYRGFVRERYMTCGLFGALAAMTRVPGIVLLPVFAASLVRDVALRRKRFRPAMLLVGLIACGTGAVMCIQWRAFGDPLAFLHAQSESYRKILLPGRAILRDFKHMLMGWDFLSGDIEYNLMIDDFTAVLVGLASLYFFKRYGFLDGLLSLALFSPVLLLGFGNGIVRYILPIFFIPIFLAEVGAKRPMFHALWVFASSALLAHYMVCYACWYWTA